MSKTCEYFLLKEGYALGLKCNKVDWQHCGVKAVQRLYIMPTLFHVNFHFMKKKRWKDKNAIK